MSNAPGPPTPARERPKRVEELSTKELLAHRLIAQGLAGSAARPRYDSATAVARALLALQGQTYPAGIRALGLRSGLDDAAVLREVAALHVVHSWPQRGTLHFIAAEDARWLSRFLFPRMEGSQKGHRKNVGLDDNMVNKAREALYDNLARRGTEALSRAEVYEVFGSVGIDPTEGRGSHLLRFSARRVTSYKAPSVRAR
ncbi:DNA glycosylase AlkZ-like family protein [Corynebacterium lowii]|uniref:DNA glycosylase AlkZ-like family protein n=1 Tax=Corynebacterium lowii TaxID=1544413 RepID=UPI00277FB7A4|nr:crosslink repair DNA glycosylase YcaQ family protein [Corynebacterium lowii]MDP9850595.1 hypothetical protein [Corynebacterium lowii]